MELLDFLTRLPGEEKDFFLNLLEESQSVNIAVRGTMMILAESEPKLARKLEGPVREWLQIKGPLYPEAEEPARDKKRSGIFAFGWK